MHGDALNRFTPGRRARPRGRDRTVRTLAIFLFATALSPVLLPGCAREDG